MAVEIEREKKNFRGLRVGSFESRMKAEMARLIENLGGEAHVAASMREVPVEQHKDVLAFGEHLLAGEIQMVILMTGVGTRALIKILSSKFPQADLLAALSKTTLVVRGPKPLKALGELNLKPTITVPEPNTWREILKTLDAKMDLKGWSVSVQEYGESNNLFLAELGARGAKVKSVRVYRAALPEDTGPMKELIKTIIEGKIDALLFTNATQVENVMSVAREEGIAQEFRTALSRVAVASVGPTCTEALRKYSLPIDIEPERPMMGALVAETADQAEVVLKAKRNRSVSFQPAPAGQAPIGSVLYDSLFLKACRKEKTPRPPIWLMRQAGRYMKEYRELRAKTPFMDLCKNSDLASEVTVDAAHRLGVDAAIIFSDLLLIAEPLGFELSYGKDQGPVIANPFRRAEDLKRMKPVDPESSMGYLFDAIRKTRAALKPDLPLIGFAGAPFTMASYLIEGKGSKNFVNTKKLMHEDETTWTSLLEKITTASIHYLNSQIHAGVQAVQVFDSWVGCLTPEDYKRYVFPHQKRLIQGILPGVPVISFGTQTGGFLQLLAEAGGDVIGVDWRIELDQAWEVIGHDKAIMGNLDPTVLLSSKEEVISQAQRILKQAGGRPGHIFNLGHGVLPETPIENVLALIEMVKNERNFLRTSS